MKIAVSFLSITENIKENVRKLDNTSIDYLHVDIMDGEFVSNKTWDIQEVSRILEGTTKPKDVHLMVKDIYRYIDSFATLNPHFITVHLEALQNPIEVIDYIKSKNIKVGFSIKPNTEISKLEPYLKYLDLVLLMSVEPGAGGQKFIKTTSEKISKLKEQQKKYNFLIEVDGGINDKTIDYCKDADILVIGSFITNSDDYEEQIKKVIK